MNIENPPVFDYLLASGGVQLRCQILPIGVWNMDTTDSINVPFNPPIPVGNIRSISAQVTNDAGNQSYQLTMCTGFGGAMAPQGGIGLSSGTLVQLGRLIGGQFDLPAYGAGGGNRGYVTVFYV